MAITKDAASAGKPEELAGATKFDASGAIIEPGIIDKVDFNHPSVDNQPRKGSTADMNRIDFNEPSALTPPEEAVAKNLKAQA